MRVLDLAAGTGRTTEAILPALSPKASVLCVEPAAAMRDVARARLRDPRVEYAAQIPVGGEYACVVCGAALWQLQGLPEVFARLADSLVPGGRLVFTVPSAYLGNPDRPGAGADPHLLELFAILGKGRVPKAEPMPPPPQHEDLLRMLEGVGLRVDFEHLEYRLTQREYVAWCHIPVITDALLWDLDLLARDRLLVLAKTQLDLDSFRWEGWSVYTADK